MQNVNQLSPLILAYIGDAVFEIMVRERILEKSGNISVNKISKKVTDIVNAASQSALYMKVEDRLSEEERAVMKRGRNPSSHTRAKHQKVTDYRRATGLEALFGYLYLLGKKERLNEIFEICMRDENES